MTECCSQHGNLAASLTKIDEKLDQVLDRLGRGDTSIALLTARVDSLDEKTAGIIRVMAWGTGLVLAGVGGAVLKLVILNG